MIASFHDIFRLGSRLNSAASKLAGMSLLRAQTRVMVTSFYDICSRWSLLSSVASKLAYCHFELKGAPGLSC